jgi:hypothetical protein
MSLGQVLVMVFIWFVVCVRLRIRLIVVLLGVLVRLWLRIGLVAEMLRVRLLLGLQWLVGRTSVCRVRVWVDVAVGASRAVGVRTRGGGGVIGM